MLNQWNKKPMYNAETGGSPAPAADVPAPAPAPDATPAPDAPKDAAPAAGREVKKDAEVLNDALAAAKDSTADPAKDGGKAADTANPGDELEGGKKDGAEKPEEGEGSKYLGAPEGDYAPLSVAGVEADPEVMEIASPAFKELGLSQEGAQRVAELYQEVYQVQESAFIEEINLQFDHFTSNPEYWKDGKLTEEASAAYATMRAIDPEVNSFVEFLRNQGGLFHPGFAKLAMLVKSGYGEGKLDMDGDAAGQNAEKWREFYKSTPGKKE